MIDFSVLYPHAEGASFDFEYYLERHVPLLRDRAGDALVAFKLQRGLSGVRPGSAPSHVAVATLTFRSLDDVTRHFFPHLRELGADIANFTDITPQILLSEQLV